MGKRPALLKDRKAKAELILQEEQLRSPFTVVERKDGEFVATPYSEAYKYHLDLAAAFLRDAAALTGDYGLKAYLTSRAKALGDNLYETSERASLHQRGPLRVFLGPSYTHEDQLMGYKAAFGALILYVDEKRTREIQGMWRYLPQFAAQLPQGKNPFSRISGVCPLGAAYELYSAGYPRAGFHPVSFAYPFTYGFDKLKRVTESIMLLSNVVEAKFSTVVLPLGQLIVNPDQHRFIKADAFSRGQVFMELAAYVGPTQRRVGRDLIPVMDILKSVGPVMEAAKNRVVAMAHLGWQVTKKRHGTEADLKAGYVTSLVSLFRYLLVDPTSTYARAGLILLNRLLSEKAVTFDMSALTFTINFEKIPGTIDSLLKEILGILDTGDEAQGKAFVKRWAALSPEVVRSIEKYRGSRIEVYPSYPLLGVLGIGDREWTK
ncbi:hypothetical protein KKF84_22480, partial [Myxococcota bacterium]|nr:hypothetical protein [Myxococcota bacterium]MBU1538096.1 hypothetical protein [Myxococcota bacterium]